MTGVSGVFLFLAVTLNLIQGLARIRRTMAHCANYLT